MPTTITVGARSIFVTTTAWVFMLLGALACAWALVQNALLVGGGAAVDGAPVSGLIGLLVTHLPWVVNAGLAMSLATLASAVGLLLRLNWARRTFIALLLLAIVANLLGLGLQQEVMQSVADTTLSTTALPPQALGVFGGFVTAARVMAVLVTLGACGLLGWIIRRLMSPTVRQEFA